MSPAHFGFVTSPRFHEGPALRIGPDTESANRRKVVSKEAGELAGCPVVSLQGGRCGTRLQELGGDIRTRFRYFKLEDRVTARRCGGQGAVVNGIDDHARDRELDPRPGGVRSPGPARIDQPDLGSTSAQLFWTVSGTGEPPWSSGPDAVITYSFLREA